MKVVFVALGMEQLGISILSAVLRRAGIDTALVFNPALFHDRYYFDVPGLRDLFECDDRVVDEVVAEQPDLIAFSVLTPTYTWCLDIARRARARTGAPVIFGGVHPSAVPDVCLENDFVDYVCVGEGEAAIVELCEALDGGAHRPVRTIPNLCWRGDDGAIVRGPAAAFFQDLDSLPYWDKALWDQDLRVGDNYLTMTSRGCPYRCTFCFNNFFAKLPGRKPGKYVRQRSVEHVMGELLEMKARYRLRRIDFEDDIFTVDKDWLKTFLGEYRREIGVPFQCLVHPRYMDRDIAFWLRDAGCQHVQMGIQSADEQFKRKVLLRLEKDSHLEHSLDVMKQAGLALKLDHILGLPGEPASAQQAARQLYLRYPPRRIQTFWLTYVPGIDLTRQALEEGYLTQREVDDIERGKTRLFRHPHLETRSGERERMELLQKYDLLFRVFPVLPPWVRRRLQAEHIPKLPSSVANAIGFAADAGNAAVRLDAETMAFVRHYAFQLGRQLPEKLLGRFAPKRAKRRRPAPSAPEAGRRAGVGHPKLAVV